ncbi:hypothetical protein G6F32_015299 [Rhizopus arrhizus]|nr:hypothetical protein G6F32_015299 [Rhizopus arrhizus]
MVAREAKLLFDQPDDSGRWASDHYGVPTLVGTGVSACIQSTAPTKVGLYQGEASANHTNKNGGDHRSPPFRFTRSGRDQCAGGVRLAASSSSSWALASAAWAAASV